MHSFPDPPDGVDTIEEIRAELIKDRDAAFVEKPMFDTRKVVLLTHAIAWLAWAAKMRQWLATGVSDERSDHTIPALLARRLALDVSAERMSKASEYADKLRAARAVVPPPLIIGNNVFTGINVFTARCHNGDLRIETHTISIGLDAEHVPKLIEWLRETFLD